MSPLGTLPSVRPSRRSGSSTSAAVNGLALTHGGLHELAAAMVVAAACFLLLVIADRSLGRMGERS